jgi:hypothetical protein
LSTLNLILQNDRLTQGLDDEEARMLIEWLVDRAEKLPDEAVESLCRRVRSIARFVALWCHERLHGPALQLAASERFGWPLPIGDMDAGDLMAHILAWESQARGK